MPKLFRVRCQNSGHDNRQTSPAIFSVSLTRLVVLCCHYPEWKHINGDICFLFMTFGVIIINHFRIDLSLFWFTYLFVLFIRYIRAWYIFTACYAIWWLQPSSVDKNIINKLDVKTGNTKCKTGKFYEYQNICMHCNYLYIQIMNWIICLNLLTK